MHKLITILGATATGKTTLAAHLALKVDGEIISADSRQIYKGMDIGTGKDLEDYTINGKQIPYHLIDIRPAGYKYNIYEFYKDFHKAKEDIESRSKQAILCGGSGLYLETVLKGYNMIEIKPNEELRMKLEGKTIEELAKILQNYPDYKAHNTTDLETTQRAIRAIEIADYYYKNNEKPSDLKGIDSIVIGVNVDRELRRKRISDRLRQRLDSGMVDEVRDLLNSGISPDDLIYYGLEYKFITNYIIGKISYQEMVDLLEIAIHQFAKRQMTWFRGMEKRGIKIHWIDGTKDVEDRLKECLEYINAQEE
ncbi:MAG: tRNA (adenosine(37)-N6)-dimethylallyltransferase MiaA [Candidatus Aphodosoma sp.]